MTQLLKYRPFLSLGKFCLSGLIKFSLIFAGLSSYAQSNQKVLFPSKAPSKVQPKTTMKAIQNVKNSKFSGEWHLRVRGEHATEATDEHQIMVFRPRAKVNYYLLENLKFHTEVQFNVYSGRVQKRFDNSISESGVSFQDFHIAFSPLKFVTLKAGANNQKFLNSDLLIAHRAFPGVQEIVNFDLASDLSAEIIAQQSIPTSISLNSQRADKEVSPSFFSETFNLKYQLSRDTYVQTYLSHYSYRNLPSSVAFESSLMGNSVSNATVRPSARFAYAYEGFLAGAQFCYCSKKAFNFKLGANTLRNSQAPENLNQGANVYISTNIYMDDLVLTPRVESFYNERDTSPASYNEGRYGHNNRMGSRYDLTLSFKQQGFNIHAGYVDAKPIQNNPHQNQLQSAWLGLETSYAGF